MHALRKVNGAGKGGLGVGTNYVGYLHLLGDMCLLVFIVIYSQNARVIYWLRYLWSLMCLIL